jgi:exodeoxyribonuclease VII large subunit
LPEFPKTIGVITSKQGAVINDFLNNLGRFGFRIKMIDSRVEGDEATKDLLAAIKTFRDQEIDVLVIMRGGGSLESFLAFNNEMFVREVAGFPVPVIAAIGHDKDVPLVALAADEMVSTPTAAANLLSAGWQQLRFRITEEQNIIFNGFEEILGRDKYKIRNIFSRMESYLRDSIKKYTALEYEVKQMLPKILENQILKFKQVLRLAETVIAQNDPERNLKLGYSLIRKNGKIVRKLTDVAVGDDLDLQVSDGIIISQVRNKSKK